MKEFAQLVYKLGTSTKTNEKLRALREYFSTAEPSDVVWVIAVFSGRRPRRIVNTTLLIELCLEVIKTPGWLFGECYNVVGDLAETITLLLPGNKQLQNKQQDENLSWYLNTFLSIYKESDDIKKEFIFNSWNKMDQREIFVFNKLITGSFRIGVSQTMIVNALSQSLDLPSSVIAHRISGNWDPSTTTLNELLYEANANADHSKPYPFYLAYAVEDDPSKLGDINNWSAEWKWDGIRGQIIKRNEQLFVWSRGEELVTDKFPEYQAFAGQLPDGTVLDGEIICLDRNVEWGVIKPLPFAVLQTRIGRKNISKKQLEEAPVGFIAYDLLEFDGNDLRNEPLTERRRLLTEIIQTIHHPSLLLSTILEPESWESLADTRSGSRDMGSEGIMLKRKSSPYQSGRKKGDWWKWKIDALTIDAVMVYAQKGSGRRSNLYTDYTFAVRDGEALVPFAKAYSGLTDKEFAQVDSFVRRNSLEKFGPVRTVKPELVFEIAFEGIAASNRHKSGVAVRFPRISRWRRDKTVDEINTLEDLKLMLNLYGVVKT